MLLGSIPARAGEPRCTSNAPGPRGVYPRPRGGTPLPQIAPSTQFRRFVFSFPGQRSDLHLVLAVVLGDDCLNDLRGTKKQHTVTIGLMPSNSIRNGLGERGGILYDKFPPEYCIWSFR